MKFSRELIGALIFLALLPLLVFYKNGYDYYKLSQAKKVFQAKGEKLTWDELHLTKPPQDGNGAELLLNAADQLYNLKESCHLAADGLPTMTLVVPGHARVLQHDQDLPSSPLEKGKFRHAWSDLSQQSAKGSDALQQVHEALRKPVLRVDLDYKLGLALMTPHLTKIRSVARWLSTAALSEIHEGRLDAAVDKIQDIALLTRFQKEEPVLISQLVRIAVGSIGMGATWAILQEPNLNDEELQQLQTTWSGAQILPQLEDVSEYDRVVFIDAFADLRKNGTRSKTWIAFGNIDQESNERVKALAGLGVQTWRLGFSYADEIAYLQKMQTLIEDARTFSTQKSLMALARQRSSLNKLNRSQTAYQKMGTLFTRTFTPAMERVFTSEARFETQREMTVAAIELYRYRLQIGKYPDRLEDLVPQFASEVPRDYMDGNPLRYRLNTDGTFLLYSVGEDGKDDGGDPTPDAKIDSTALLWKGRDVVWPSPATSEEVAAFETGKEK